jgi:ABC-type polysaccharide/polyol phosphate export permease
MSTKIRYKGTYVGFLWTAVEPLLIFLILFVVFSSIRVGVEEDFPIYLLTGVLFFQIFTKGTQTGLTSLRSNASIIKSFNLNKEFFPITAVSSTGILLLIQLSVLFILMPFFEFIPTASVIFLVIPILLLLVLILGLSYLLSIIFVYVKDIQSIWSIFSYALFFVSPIFWYLHKTEGILLTIHGINPLGQIIELAHSIVFNEIPTVDDLVIPTIYSFAVLFFGYFIFRKFEKRIAEEL